MNKNDAPFNTPKPAHNPVHNNSATPQNSIVNAPAPVAVNKPTEMTHHSHVVSSASVASPLQPTKPMVAPQSSLNLAKNESIKSTKPAFSKVAEKPKSKKIEVKKATPKSSFVAAKKSDNVVSLSSSAATDVFASTAEKVTKNVKDKVDALTLDGVKKIAENADRASRLLNESMCIRRNHMEACAEAGAVAAKCTTKLSEIMMNYVNDAMTDSVEISKSFFGCRTASDLFALQNRFRQSSVQRFLDESSRASSILFRMASEASEPFAERLSDVSDGVHKALKN